ncbi:type IV pili twitching motility protein PilT [Candidatus Parcubacteria bacterium]|nr:MAG: type IV pili twitching motility protein PilT [Candidatus Parcubacteria bacterium]
MTAKELFLYAIEKNASDIHLVASVPPLVRIDGKLNYVEGQKELKNSDIEAIAFSIISDDQKERFNHTKDLDFGFELDEHRFRVNLSYEKRNVRLVARVINNEVPSLDEIGMPKVIYNLLGLKQGLILLTGPTGCCKSTTLAAMIEYINDNEFKNIITFEDPVEFVFESKKSVISQRELGSDMLSFGAGLKHAMRQDPNVIMVGEMRDLETIATTITLAETGHLVLATLHTYNAAQTIDRIIDAFPPHQQNQVRMQLSMTLASVISQRLLPKQGGGRVAAREIMLNTSAVSNMIREQKIAQIKSVIETSSKDGMFSMDQDIQRIYKDKEVEKEVAQSYMDHPELLDKFKIL